MPGITLQEVGGSLVIVVPDEQTQIGRGQFLQITDKRVSRSHALLDVIDTKLFLTPTHTNPCFLKRQGSKEHSIMAKDIKTLLNHGDAFGLLPDQLFYLVSYPQVNGNKDAEKVEDKEDNEEELKNEPEKSDETSSVPEKVNGDGSKKEGSEKTDPEQMSDEEAKDDIKDEETKDAAVDKKKEEVETPAGNMALPLDKKRPLPGWMHKVSDSSPTKPKASPKKVTAAAVSKREPGEKLTKVDKTEDLEEEEEEEEEEQLPKKTARSKVAKVSDEEDEDFDEAVSDDDYVPEVLPRAQSSRSRRRKKDSDSEEDFSDDDDDDDDYAPSKKKARTPKKSPKGKAKKAAKGRQTPSRTSKRATPRAKRKTYSEEDDEEEVLPRRRGGYKDDEDDSPTRGRPQRAARQKRGSYVDDPLIEEALEDFAGSEDSAEAVNEGKDSDFDVNDALDSGSDYEKKNKKQRLPKPPTKVTKSPRSASKKGKKKAPRRPSRSKDYSDDDDEDEDDEPYVPRPSKRRGGAASQESGESDDEKKKKRRREPCQYGRKCYRKNPVHFRTYCHPGDSSYDEEDKDTSAAKDEGKKAKEANKTSPEKPSRPQRSTAGTRLVTQGGDDDDQPDTYDYNDSFIDDGTQELSDDSGQDSDYDAEGDARNTNREAKKFLKNKKMVKPVGAD